MTPSEVTNILRQFNAEITGRTLAQNEADGA